MGFTWAFPHQEDLLWRPIPSEGPGSPGPPRSPWAHIRPDISDAQSASLCKKNPSHHPRPFPARSVTWRGPCRGGAGSAHPLPRLSFDRGMSPLGHLVRRSNPRRDPVPPGPLRCALAYMRPYHTGAQSAPLRQNHLWRHSPQMCRLVYALLIRTREASGSDKPPIRVILGFNPARPSLFDLTSYIQGAHSVRPQIPAGH